MLGAVAGVGKTYAMLEAARERSEGEVDVVAGWVETPEPSAVRVPDLSLLPYAGAILMTVLLTVLAAPLKNALGLVNIVPLSSIPFPTFTYSPSFHYWVCDGASGGRYSPEARLELLQNIRQGAMRMNRFVNNLLDMARLESGLMQLNQEWCDIKDIIGVAVSRIDEQLYNRPLNIALRILSVMISATN